MIGAVSLSGLLSLGAVGGITFNAFIARKLVPKLWKGAVVIMDKAISVKKGTY